MKTFFGINEKFRVEFADITTIITIFNVAFILMGFWWAPVFGLINCTLGVYMNIKNRLHINMYITQIAFIVLNIYFLTM